jgi:hypothetical protein
VGKLQKWYVKLEGWQTSFRVAENSDFCYFSFNEIYESQKLIPLLVSKTSRILSKWHHILCFVDRASWYICIKWTNKMHYFLWIYFNIKPLHVSSRLASHHQEGQLCINSNWYSNALHWLAAAAASQHNALLYQLLFLHSWSSWWWEASLLETCRGLILK